MKINQEFELEKIYYDLYGDIYTKEMYETEFPTLSKNMKFEQYIGEEVESNEYVVEVYNGIEDERGKVSIKTNCWEHFGKRVGVDDDGQIELCNQFPLKIINKDSANFYLSVLGKNKRVISKISTMGKPLCTFDLNNLSLADWYEIEKFTKPTQFDTQIVKIVRKFIRQFEK